MLLPSYRRIILPSKFQSSTLPRLTSNLIVFPSSNSLSSLAKVFNRFSKASVHSNLSSPRHSNHLFNNKFQLKSERQCQLASRSTAPRASNSNRSSPTATNHLTHHLPNNILFTPFTSLTRSRLKTAFQNLPKTSTIMSWNKPSYTCLSSPLSFSKCTSREYQPPQTLKGKKRSKRSKRRLNKSLPRWSTQAISVFSSLNLPTTNMRVLSTIAKIKISQSSSKINKSTKFKLSNLLSWANLSRETTLSPHYTNPPPRTWPSLCKIRTTAATR